MHSKSKLLRECEIVRSAPIRRLLETMETARAVTMPLIQTIFAVNALLTNDLRDLLKCKHCIMVKLA